MAKTMVNLHLKGIWSSKLDPASKPFLEATSVEMEVVHKDFSNVILYIESADVYVRVSPGCPYVKSFAQKEIHYTEKELDSMKMSSVEAEVNTFNNIQKSFLDCKQRLSKEEYLEYIEPSADEEEQNVESSDAVPTHNTSAESVDTMNKNNKRYGTRPKVQREIVVKKPKREPQRTKTLDRLVPGRVVTFVFSGLYPRRENKKIIVQKRLVSLDLLSIQATIFGRDEDSMTLLINSLNLYIKLPKITNYLCIKLMFTREFHYDTDKLNALKTSSDETECQLYHTILSLFIESPYYINVDEIDLTRLHEFTNNAVKRNNNTNSNSNSTNDDSNAAHEAENSIQTVLDFANSQQQEEEDEDGEQQQEGKQDEGEGEDNLEVLSAWL